MINNYDLIFNFIYHFVNCIKTNLTRHLKSKIKSI